MPLSVLTDLRDIVIVIAGLIAVLGGIVFLVMTLVLGILSIRLVRAVRKTVAEGVPPILSQAEETVRTVRGTADFLGRIGRRTGHPRLWLRLPRAPHAGGAGRPSERQRRIERHGLPPRFHVGSAAGRRRAWSPSAPPATSPTAPNGSKPNTPATWPPP